MKGRHLHASLINAIKGFLGEERNMEVRLVYREVNKCANKLARVGHKLHMGLTFNDNLPACISIEYLADLSKITSC